jgi:RING-variant domain
MNTQERNGDDYLSTNDAYSKASSQESYPERQRHPGGYPSPQEQEPAEVAEDITTPSSAPQNATLPDISATDERQCRICLAGSDEEEELGPLIRPCKCKGSIKVRAE